MIEGGEVMVNGEPAHLGQKIVPGTDRVTVRGKLINAAATVSAAKVTIALHKPRGVVCGTPDGRHPETVFDLLPRSYARQRFLLVGRLDLEAEGLVILTSDGALADRLARASSQVVRRFLVTLAEPFAPSRLAQLIRGVNIEDERVRATHAELLHPGADGQSSAVEVHMTHGRGRGVRELFTTLGCDVNRLQCYQIGALKLRGMPLRGAKVLTNHDIDLLTRSD
jgi:23S rRNA pseudouridine2605 synthase